MPKLREEAIDLVGSAPAAHVLRLAFKRRMWLHEGDSTPPRRPARIQPGTAQSFAMAQAEVNPDEASFKDS